MKINDEVEILTEREGGMNRFGRVVKFDDEFVWVTNMNMPYDGTLIMAKFYRKDIK